MKSVLICFTLLLLCAKIFSQSNCNIQFEEFAFKYFADSILPKQGYKVIYDGTVSNSGLYLGIRRSIVENYYFSPETDSLKQYQKSEEYAELIFTEFDSVSSYIDTVCDLARFKIAGEPKISIRRNLKPWINCCNHKTILGSFVYWVMKPLEGQKYNLRLYRTVCVGKKHFVQICLYRPSFEYFVYFILMMNKRLEIEGWTKTEMMQ